MRLTRGLWTGYGGYALGFASLFVVWQLASLYLVSSVLFPPPTIVVVSQGTAAGDAAVAPNSIRAAESLVATRAQIFFHVALPATVADILTGMRPAMAISFATVVAAEMIAANDGLGKMLWDRR